MRFSLIAVAVLACCSFAAAQEILNLGHPAPPLVVSGWVKGDKVETLEAGTTYVVEFWATWCGPCRASIPHLTEVAHKYKDQGVRVIGVDVWERDTSRVQPFIQEMGSEMDYSVALDSVPPGGTGDDGVMAKTWLAAAAESGIPTAFIIRDAKIAWIGHPLQMDEPLVKIIADNWNPQDLAAQRLIDKAKEIKVTAAREKIFKPYREKDYKTTLALIEETTANDPELVDELALLKFTVLNYTDDVEATLALGTKLSDTNKDEPHMLNAVAWPIVRPDRDQTPDPRLAQLALQASQRANELTKREDYHLLDTLACALYRTGDYAGAISTEEKALHLLEQASKDRSHPYIAQFQKQIELFRAALKEKPSQPQ